jgi:hypothetical protein
MLKERRSEVDDGFSSTMTGSFLALRPPAPDFVSPLLFNSVMPVTGVCISTIFHHPVVATAPMSWLGLV